MKVASSFTRTRVHIVSGMVLATFILSHFLNHALGLFSIDLMEEARGKFNLIWRSWPGTVLLYGALLVHFLAALDALYRRHSLRMPIGEALKIAFGLSLPFLLANHVVGTRVELMLSGYDRGYPEVMRILWSSASSGIWYSVALVIAWSHACLGFWFWLRAKPWFQRSAAMFHMVAVLVPVLALLGFFSATRVAFQLPRPSGQAVQADPALINNIIMAIQIGVGLVIAIIILIKLVPRKDRIRIHYPGGRIVAVSPGFSVLEASRSAGIPHVSICGGRGRCSTCRIQLLEGLADQPAADSRERATLHRVNAPADVRLACQLRPIHDLTILPLIQADGQTLQMQLAHGAMAGRERMLAALFCDLRGFTQLSEQKLPYDIVFLLNRYFAMVDDAVESSGGVVDKFIGDGVIALFGLDTPFEQACLQALTAATRLGIGMEAFNKSFSAELDAPLRIAMGLHAGPAIVGRMGHGRAASLTAVGDTINTASRLEGLAKERNVELAVSDDLVKRAGVTLIGMERQELTIRGRAATLETWIVPKAVDIVRLLDVPAAVSEAGVQAS